jgi:hypothetical protein
MGGDRPECALEQLKARSFTVRRCAGHLLNDELSPFTERKHSAILHPGLQPGIRARDDPIAGIQGMAQRRRLPTSSGFNNHLSPHPRYITGNGRFGLRQSCDDQQPHTDGQ